MPVKNFDRLAINEIGENTWQIVENDHVAMYLLTGKERALLVDAGWGIGNIPGALRSLTELPLTLVITHAHPDHVCGAYNFNDIYISEGDRSGLDFFYKKEVRARILETRFKEPYPDGFSKEQWINAVLNKVEVIGEGYVFDLGGRRVEVISNPGHTPGSISLLDETNGYLFTGDTVKYDQILMQLESSLTLSVYLESLKHIDSYRGRFRRILPGHGSIIESPDFIDEIISGASGILAGKIHGVFEETFHGPGYVAKLDHCSIVYRKDKLQSV